MPTVKNPRSTKKKTPAELAPAKPKKTPAAKPKPSARESGRKTQPLGPSLLRKAIVYVQLLSFCPPKQVGGFLIETKRFREEMARSSGMEEADFLSAAIPAVCFRIAAFHQETREPDQAVVDALQRSAMHTADDPDRLAAFQTEMAKVAALPPRAKPENRLHANRGCLFCQSPCRYGYFSLVSEPDLGKLQSALAAEAAKPAGVRSPVETVHRFTLTHLSDLTGVQKKSIEGGHLANLSYCFLVLGLAKSRLAPPERELQFFQTTSQKLLAKESEN